jgi:hypothetical protein
LLCGPGYSFLLVIVLFCLPDDPGAGIAIASKFATTAVLELFLATLAMKNFHRWFTAYLTCAIFPRKQHLCVPKTLSELLT